MNSIAKIVIDLPVEGPFDYSVPEEFRPVISVGMRALVPFGRRNIAGFIVGLQDKADVASVKPIEKLLDKGPVIDDRQMELSRKISSYYGCSWGEAIAASLPGNLRKTTRSEIPPVVPFRNEEIKKAVYSLYADSRADGINSFIEDNLRDKLAKGKSVIIVVPEAGKVKEMAKKLTARSFPVILYHGLGQKKETEVWAAMRTAGPYVVVGTRSAVFARPDSLDLIIILDEDNPAHEQEQPPHYNTFGIARMRAETEGVDLKIINPAPRAETWLLANEEKWEMIEEADKSRNIQIIDMTNYKGKGGLISFPLQSELSSLLLNNASALLLMNRRGFAGRTVCNKCGYIMKCPRCDVNLTYIYSKKKLACGRCKYAVDLPRFCPQCNTEYLHSSGAGIEKLESDLARMYPQAKIAVYDRDTEVLPKGMNIIVATQAVLRWSNSYRPALTAVLDLDAELNRFDFRSGQKAFSLLRRLRGMTIGKMYAQTFMPDNPTVKLVVDNDPDVFYREELKLRREMSLPPYKRLLEIVMRGESEETVLEQGRLLHEKLNELNNVGIEISDLHPGVMPKLRDNFRFALVIKGDNMEQLLSLAKTAIKQTKRKRGILITYKIV
jgi:primosomal protein N' (replication factor Y)